MTEREVIQSAYEDAVKTAFSVLHAVLITADTKAEREAAESRFKKGIAIAQDAREVALKHFPA